MLNRNDFKEIWHPSFCGIDLNSKFELSPGIKNIECLSEFIKNIKDEE
jgi:phosphoribosylanthranilate isomerase